VTERRVKRTELKITDRAFLVELKTAIKLHKNQGLLQVNEWIKKLKQGGPSGCGI
jgi:hypothetical protein